MRSKRISRILHWLMPAFMYVIGETVTGNLGTIGFLPMVLNLMIYYLLYGGMLVLFRTTRYSWPVLSLALFMLAVLEYFVISFRERPAMFWDLLAIRTAMTVSANYNFAMTPTLAASGIAVLFLSFAAWKWPWTVGEKKEPWKRSARRVSAWAAGTVVFGTLLFGFIAPHFHLEVPMWDPVVSFEKEGYLLSSVLSFKAMIAPKPDGYSAELAENLLVKMDKRNEEYNNDAGVGEHTGLGSESEQQTPVNVICIMNESFSDLRLFNGLVDETRGFETDAPFLSYYDRLKEAPNVQTGDLYVPVFGAMTANSEYEFLTGNSCAFVPQGSIPYQYYTKPEDESLAKIFGEQGFTTIAMHPYPGYNWNRTEAYENLGFDEFLDQEFYDELEQELLKNSPENGFTKPRDYLSDRSDYDSILHLLKEKEAGEKLFIFNVTMQNHGGFEVEGLESTVHVTELNGESCKGLYPKTDQYLTLIQMSDQALEEFLGELEQVEEPTMVVMFGDHQPSVETEFFESLYGMDWADVPGEQKLHSFRTPYLIWTNYERDAEDAGDMSAFMLGSEVLQQAGITPAGLFAASLDLREHYDAVHAMGVLEKDGTFLDSRTEDVWNEKTDIREFHMIQYYEIFE